MTDRGTNESLYVGSEPNFHRLKLRDICGIHPEINNILLLAGASDLINDPIPLISSADVERYSKENPISLHLYKKNFYVVANIRAYFAIGQLGNKNLPIFVRIYAHRMNKTIRELIRNELLIYSSMHRGSYDPNYIYRIHLWMSKSKNYNGLDNVPSSKYGFSKWVNVNVRKIK